MPRHHLEVGCRYEDQNQSTANCGDDAEQRSCEGLVNEVRG